MVLLPLDAPVRRIALELQAVLIDQHVVGADEIRLSGTGNEVFVLLRNKEIRIRGASDSPICVAVRPIGGEFGLEYNPKTPDGAVGLGSLLLR